MSGGNPGKMAPRRISCGQTLQWLDLLPNFRSMGLGLWAELPENRQPSGSSLLYIGFKSCNAAPASGNLRQLWIGHVLSSGVMASHHPVAGQAASCSTSTGSSSVFSTAKLL